MKCAAGNTSGIASFDPGPESQTGWGGLASPSTSENSSAAEVIRLDEVINYPVDFMKIDVEGAGDSTLPDAVDHKT